MSSLALPTPSPCRRPSGCEVVQLPAGCWCSVSLGQSDSSVVSFATCCFLLCLRDRCVVQNREGLCLCFLPQVPRPSVRLELIFIRGVKQASTSFFCVWVPVAPAPLAEKTNLPAFGSLGTCVAKELSADVRACFWTCSRTPALRCSLKLRSTSPPILVLLFKIVLAILGPLLFHVHFRIHLSISVKNSH